VRIVTTWRSTIPFPIVEATAVPVRAPVRLKNAAIVIAWRGVSTLVETTVAMALAASWKPLMYSKTTAARTTRMKRIIQTVAETFSRIFEHHLENDVPCVTAAVDDFLQQFVKVAQEDNLLRIVVAVVQIAQQIQLQFVCV